MPLLLDEKSFRPWNGHDRKMPDASVPLVDFLQQLDRPIWAQAGPNKEQGTAREEQTLRSGKQGAFLLWLCFAIVGVIVRLSEGPTDAILPVAM